MALPTSLPAGHELLGTESQGIIDEINKLRLFKRKTVDETVNNSATQQNDDELFLALEANSTYTFELVAQISGANTTDFACQFTVPASSTGWWASATLDTTNTGSFASGTASFKVTGFGTSTNFGTVAVGTKSALIAKGVVVTSATAGNLQFVWAQDVAGASNTTVYANSWLSAMKVA